MSAFSLNATLFVTKFREYGHISDEVAQQFDAKVQSVSKKKGSYIVREGQMATSFFVIKKGLVRSFFNRDGEDITVWFGCEGQQFAAVASFFDNKPSHETIECMEDCEFEFVSGKDLNDMYAKYNDLNTIGRKILEDYCKILDQRIFSMQTMSAENRYKALIKNEPEVIKRAPLNYIASYLGISPETLSRVRKR